MVVANDGSNWVLDADLQNLNHFWRFWIMERRPVSWLTWNLGERYRKVSVQDQKKTCAFFSVVVKIGRKMLGARSWKEPAANVFRRLTGLSPQHLKQFWKWLWAVLSMVVQDQPMVYMNKTMLHTLLLWDMVWFKKKKFIPLNLQIEIGKPKIWQLVSSITIWYIWKVRCLTVRRYSKMWLKDLPK